MGAALVGTYGKLTLNANGSYTYIVDETNAKVQALNSTGLNTALDDVFNYTMSDGAITDKAKLVITINGADDAAVAVNDTGSATEKGGVANGSGGKNATGNVLTNDFDVDSPCTHFTVTGIRAGNSEGKGVAGTVGMEFKGSYGKLTLNADGSYSY